MPGKTTVTTTYLVALGTTAQIVVTNTQLEALLNAAPEAGLSFMVISNSGASGNISFTRANGVSPTMSVLTPVINGPGTTTLTPGQSVTYGGLGSTIPLNTIAAIGSATGCQFTVEVG